MRALTTVLAMGFILFSLFAHMAITYLAGGYLEMKFGQTIPGIHHLVNIFSLMLTVVMVIATLLTLAERKWSAMMQDRIGPNRARINLPVIKNFSIAGVPHILTDVFKMLTKEAFRPAGASKFLFNLAPILAFAPAFALFAVVPAGPTVTVFDQTVSMVPTNPDFGVLFIFAIASLAVYGTSLAGWSSNNKFALLGGVRASSQMISYEVALGLSLVGMMMAFSTVRLAGDDGMSALQAKPLYSAFLGDIDIGLPQWGVILQPIGFLLFFAAAFAETKRAPFDTPEGESEIVGYFLEYSGMQFGLFMISEFVEVVILSGVLTAIFFGGWSLPIGNVWLQNLSVMKEYPWVLGAFGGMVFWVKVILLCYLQLAIRWTFPRFRYDQVQTLGWKILLPLGLVNLFVTGALILFDPTLRSLGLFGLLEIGVILFLTVTPSRQQRAEAAHSASGHGHGALGASGHAASALPHGAHAAPDTHS